MTNPIVTVNVTQTVAPAPSTLQSTGALISQGATTTAANTRTLLTSAADLAGILKGALALSTLAWSGSVVTATTAAPHGIANGEVLELTIAGASPAGYNGTFLCTVTGASTFTYPLVSNPGSETVPGTYTPEDVAELSAMVATFFAQGSGQAVYVLELGPTSPADGAAALGTYITNNQGFFYSYLVPRTWDAVAGFLTLLAGFQTTTSKTYFYVTTTDANYTSYASMKCVKAMIEAPGVPVSEFSHAADFQHDLAYAPSSTNKVTPNAFAFLFGVTSFPQAGNQAKLTAYKAAGVNVVGTGSEAGISTAILLWGTTMDVQDFTYWYSVDWVQINIDLEVSNAVVNGSNSQPPLYYNQDGINRLQATAARVMSSGVAFGLVLGTVKQLGLDAPVFNAALDNGDFAGQTVVNAVPFFPYGTTNPNDYRAGRYAGFSIVYVPARGFIAIVFNVNVTQFVTQ